MGMAIDACHWVSHVSHSSGSTPRKLYKFNNVHNHLHSCTHEATIKCINASSSSSSISSPSKPLSLPVKEIKEKCKTWLWRGYSITYLTYPQPQFDPINPLLLIHGFGASIPHWRRNIATLSETHTVYAIDLLGFGASDKPKGIVYSTKIWAELILDFVEEIIQKPTVLIGNSIGSLACLIAASENKTKAVRGLVLLNCAGGMNNKAIVDDWRIKLLLPLFWLVDYLLNQKVIALFIFERVRRKDNIKNVLMSVYGNKESVDEELVEIILEPANDEGAIDAFVSIVTGEPGPNPLELIPKIKIPLLVLWGDEDPFTPLDGPVGKYFCGLQDQLSDFEMFVLNGVGHCPHDDRPDLVHSRLLPWLGNLSTGNNVNS